MTCKASVVTDICLTIVLVVLIVCITIYNIERVRSESGFDLNEPEKNDDDNG